MRGPTTRRQHAAQFIRFGLAGCVGFTVDFGTLVGLHSGVDMPLVWATLIAYAVGGIAHYSLTRYWVFPHAAATGGGELGRVTRYVLLGAANAVVTLTLVSGLTYAGLDYRVAKAIAVVVLFFTNYLLTPRLVMTSPGSRTTAPRSRTTSR